LELEEVPALNGNLDDNFKKPLGFLLKVLG
jgi:hypothetical protein